MLEDSTGPSLSELIEANGDAKEALTNQMHAAIVAGYYENGLLGGDGAPPDSILDDDRRLMNVRDEDDADRIRQFLLWMETNDQVDQVAGDAFERADQARDNRDEDLPVTAYGRRSPASSQYRSSPPVAAATTRRRYSAAHDEARNAAEAAVVADYYEDGKLGPKGGSMAAGPRTGAGIRRAGPMLSVESLNWTERTVPRALVTNDNRVEFARHMTPPPARARPTRPGLLTAGETAKDNAPRGQAVGHHEVPQERMNTPAIESRRKMREIVDPETRA